MAPADQLAGAVFWTVYVAISFAAAAWLHFAVEKPFLLLKDRQQGAPHAMAGI
jgi:peptidoglycan/LPS O-acetylase OafA/YrhL